MLLSLSASQCIARLHKADSCFGGMRTPIDIALALLGAAAYLSLALLAVSAAQSCEWDSKAVSSEAQVRTVGNQQQLVNLYESCCTGLVATSAPSTC